MSRPAVDYLFTQVRRVERGQAGWFPAASSHEREDASSLVRAVRGYMSYRMPCLCLCSQTKKGPTILAEEARQLSAEVEVVAIKCVWLRPIDHSSSRKKESHICVRRIGKKLTPTAFSTKDAWHGIRTRCSNMYSSPIMRGGHLLVKLESLSRCPSPTQTPRPTSTI